MRIISRIEQQHTMETPVKWLERINSLIDRPNHASIVVLANAVMNANDQWIVTGRRFTGSFNQSKISFRNHFSQYYQFIRGAIRKMLKNIKWIASGPWSGD